MAVGARLRMNVGPPKTGRDPKIGRVIDDRYRLLRRLGAGGMGVVYEGCHEVTGRRVAVKLLHPSAAHSPEHVERFAGEARAGAAIGHPNIVDVLDAGNLADGTPFLVMALLAGEPMGDVLEREARFTPEQAAELICQAAAALDALHAHGIIHRDVKTDNLFIEEGGCVKLLDFGLAVFTEGPVSRRLTRDGMVNGTPDYLPPEVFDGTAPNPSWDVYALATVAFELLTGVVPFEGTNPMVMLYNKREAAAPRLGDCVDVQFSEAIERVIRRGLEREPSLRHATPGELAADLRRAALPLAQPVVDPVLAPAAPLALAAAPTARTERAGIESGVHLIERLAGRALPRVAVLAGVCGAALCFALMALARPEPERTGFVIGEPRVTVVSAPVHVLPTRPSPALAAVAPLAPEVVREPEVATATTTDAHTEPRAARRGPSAPTTEPDVVRAPSAEAPAPAATGVSAHDARELTRAGTSALMRGRIADARDLLQRATLAAPESSAAWRGLGLANERMGRSTEARRAYVRYLELAPAARDADEVRRRVASL